MRPSFKPVTSNKLIPTQSVCFINDHNSGILSLHFELGRRPSQPAFRARWIALADVAPTSNQAGEASSPPCEGFLLSGPHNGPRGICSRLRPLLNR